MKNNINTGFSQSPLSSTSYFPKRSMQIDKKDFYSFLTTKEGLAENSVKNCIKTLSNINKWLVDKELSKENIEEFILYLKTEKKLKSNTLNSYLFVLRHVASYCRDRGFPNDFLEGFKSFKKTKSEIIIFTHEEIEAIINQSLSYGSQYGKTCSFLDFRYRTLTMFLAYTGCRFSEAINLKIKNIDWDGKARIIGTKTNENRVVYFTEPLASRLKKLCTNKKEEDLVFLNSRNNKINAQDFSVDLKKRARAVGITKRVFPHNFRHSYATHMLEIGVPITEVATLLGHKDIQTTYDNYMHLADKTLQRAAMRHPMVRRNVNTIEIIKVVKETLENFHIEDDPRFSFSIFENKNKLNFELSVNDEH